MERGVQIEYRFQSRDKECYARPKGLGSLGVQYRKFYESQNYVLRCRTRRDAARQFTTFR